MISGPTGSFKLTALFALLIALPLSAGGTYEMRSRWTARAHSKQTFDVTEVDRLGDSADKSAYLVTSANRHYVILVVSDYAHAKMTRIVRNIDSGEYLQMSYTYSSPFRTRAEFIAAAKSGAHDEDVSMLYQTSLGQYATRQSQLPSPETRKALSAIVSPQFAAELQHLQTNLLSQVNLRIICDHLITPLTGSLCERQSAPVVTGAKPDCDVDASFGFPCSATQRARSTKATVHVSIPTRY